MTRVRKAPVSPRIGAENARAPLSCSSKHWVRAVPFICGELLLPIRMSIVCGIVFVLPRNVAMSSTRRVGFTEWWAARQPRVSESFQRNRIGLFGAGLDLEDHIFRLMRSNCVRVRDGHCCRNHSQTQLRCSNVGARSNCQICSGARKGTPQVRARTPVNALQLILCWGTCEPALVCETQEQ